MNITIVGIGYVGLSLGMLISRKYNVMLLDIAKTKVDLINRKKSPIKDQELENFIESEKLKLKATLDKKKAYQNSDFIIIATPTNYNNHTGSFDTSSIRNVISEIIKINNNSTIIIKSTIPLGFTNEMRNQFQKEDIIFSPEFLRETKALYDNLYPSRVIVGGYTEKAREFGKLLLECSEKNDQDIPILFMDSNEAEAVKLFSNTFLAMRISYFNELDSFAEIHKLSSERIIKGVSLDPRIGNYYNNPSFGYGGYCLPKDTKQLLENFKDIPNSIMNAVVESNEIRKNFIVNSISEKKPKIVGVYRLVMKTGSDNFRESAVIDIINKLKKKKIKIILFEPFISNKLFDDIEVFADIDQFINLSDIIIANRLTHELDHVKDKVYSRDIFQEN